ncbi:MAG TPA: hypothetical protein VHG08_18150 [Longimicrobium sp.]|nr:hypothetical protein [Longimicrobium sp.]
MTLVAVFAFFEDAMVSDQPAEDSRSICNRTIPRRSRIPPDLHPNVPPVAEALPRPQQTEFLA